MLLDEGTEVAQHELYIVLDYQKDLAVLLLDCGGPWTLDLAFGGIWLLGDNNLTGSLVTLLFLQGSADHLHGLGLADSGQLDVHREDLGVDHG